jgi:hypothetical protein
LGPGRNTRTEVEILRSCNGGGVGSGLLKAALIAERAHVNREAGETAKHDESDGSSDDGLAGLFILKRSVGFH